MLAVAGRRARRRRVLLLASTLLTLLVAVAVAAMAVGWRLPLAPVPRVLDEVAGPTPVRERVLLVLLPGIRDTPRDLLREGFVRQVRERGWPVDVVLPDLHLGHHLAGTFSQRLQRDILEPARARGYRAVWLAGISLGGFGALTHARRHPASVDGLIVVAPFLAPEHAWARVDRAGGLAAWSVADPMAHDVVDGDDSGDGRDAWARRLLTWLGGYADPQQAALRPPLYVACGRDDAFAPRVAALSRLLPPGHVVDVEGAHAWAPWRQAWGLLLDAARPDIAPARPSRAR
jgi:pimeloyl-ACP methyl ester carboxylesterase